LSIWEFHARWCPDARETGYALAAERRRMPWMSVEKAYAFDGPKGKVSLF
jgi:predicted dithiol-disulfide oxidoreductase (DUF899 family)